MRFSKASCHPPPSADKKRFKSNGLELIVEAIANGFPFLSQKNTTAVQGTQAPKGPNKTEAIYTASYNPTHDPQAPSPPLPTNLQHPILAPLARPIHIKLPHHLPRPHHALQPIAHLPLIPCPQRRQAMLVPLLRDLPARPIPRQLHRRVVDVPRAVPDDRVPVRQVPAVGEAPAPEQARVAAHGRHGAEADDVDEVPVAPVVDGERLGAARLVEARRVAVQVHLVQARLRGQLRGRVAVDALREAAVAVREVAVPPAALGVDAVEVGEQGRGEEDARAAVGHVAEVADLAEVFGEAADVLLRGVVVRGEAGDEGGGGEEESVVVDEAGPVRGGAARGVQGADQGEVAVVEGLVRVLDRHVDAEGPHVGFEGAAGGARLDERDEAGLRVGEPVLHLADRGLESLDGGGHAEYDMRRVGVWLRYGYRYFGGRCALCLCPELLFWTFIILDQIQWSKYRTLLIQRFREVQLLFRKFNHHPCSSVLYSRSEIQLSQKPEVRPA